MSIVELNPQLSLNLEGSYLRRYRKTRIHVWGSEVTDMERPPYSIKGQNAENDELWKKYNRLEIKAQRDVISVALDDIALAVRIPEDFKFTFSRNAGCSCPCSPGFIVNSTLKTIDSNIDVNSIHVYA